jgi:hypothetical protein
MPAITSANVANAIVKLVAMDALPALLANLVLGNLVNRDYEPTLAETGDTVNVPIPGTLVANNIAEGTGSVQTQNPNLGNAQIVLNAHVEATFKVPDVTKVLAFPNLLKAYMQPAINAVVTRIETDLLNLYSGFTANAPLGTAATPLTEAVVDATETAFFSALVPTSEAKVLVVGANDYSNLRQIPRFSEALTVGSGLPISEGNLGKLKGMYILRSQLVQQTGNPTVNTHNIAFAKDAMALVMRRLPQPLPGTGAIAEYGEVGNFGFRVVMSYDANTLAQQFTVDALYGVAVLRNSFGIQVNS